MAENAKKIVWKRWWMICIYVFFGFVILASFIPDTEIDNSNQGNLALPDNSNTQNQDKSDVSSKIPSSSKSINVGEEGKLYVEGLEFVGVAITEESFDELTKASVAKDSIGYAKVYSEGRAFQVESNTKVLVLDRKFATTKIRILEGDYYGEAGWVPYEWVIK